MTTLTNEKSTGSDNQSKIKDIKNKIKHHEFNLYQSELLMPRIIAGGIICAAIFGICIYYTHSSFSSSSFSSSYFCYALIVTCIATPLLFIAAYLNYKSTNKKILELSTSLEALNNPKTAEIKPSSSIYLDPNNKHANQTSEIEMSPIKSITTGMN